MIDININNSSHDSKKEYIDKLNILENKIESSKELDKKTISDYIKQLFDLERNFLDQSYKKEWNRIQRLHRYLKHALESKQNLLSSILTIITTIFLPLGVIVGYFGMNFKSMGVPSLKKGIFTIPHAQHAIFWLGFISSIIILFAFLFYNLIN